MREKEVRELYEAYLQVHQPQELTEEVEIAAQYFYEMGLNEEGVEILIEELGVEEFGEFVYDLAEEYTLSEASETRLQRSPLSLKGPRGSKPQSTTKARVKTQGGTEMTSSDRPEGTMRRRRRSKRASDAVETAKEKQPEKKGSLGGIADRVREGMKRHNKAMSDTGKTLSKVGKGLGKVAGGFVSGAGGAAGLMGHLARKGLGEEVEAWVNALAEEGYDLSEYTWEDMTEMYLDEARRDPDYDKMKSQEDRHTQRAVSQSGGSRGKSKNRAFKMSSIRGALERGEDPRADTRGGARAARGNSPEDHRAAYSNNPLNNPPRRVKEPGVKKESFDLFDTILEYLVSEGYADTNEAALVIMANMSEEWKQSIVEQRVDVGDGRTVGPVAGAIHSLLTGKLPKSTTYVPPSTQTPTNRAPSIPASKGDSGKLTDFGAGGGREKMKKTGMTVGQVERQGRRNRGDYSG